MTQNSFDTENCTICPRNCKTNRKNAGGYCTSSDKFNISSICVHKGEEPPISGNKGICNVFFTHCNLQCVYCQNFQISDNKSSQTHNELTLQNTVNQIITILKTGINSVGFVSPSHFVPQMIEIIEELHKQKYFPTIIYNTNAYDKVETLKILEKYVDIYIPDLKYAFSDIAQKYSKAKDYPEIAFAAVKEMYRQKGDFLYINNNGYAESGLIIRHLVLPNNIKNSIAVMQFIAKELSPDIHISLMSQYTPMHKAFDYPEIARPITENEYNEVLQTINNLKMTNGWIQDFESQTHYVPDFEKSKPFEK